MTDNGPTVPTFDADIKTMFRESDRKAMRGAFDLWDHRDVVSHADAIMGQLRKGTMPCDGAWPAEQVERFQRWVDAGAPQ